jgi:hypothetical protein
MNPSSITFAAMDILVSLGAEVFRAPYSNWAQVGEIQEKIRI